MRELQLDVSPFHLLSSQQYFFVFGDPHCNFVFYAVFRLYVVCVRYNHKNIILRGLALSIYTSQTNQLLFRGFFFSISNFAISWSGITHFTFMMLFAMCISFIRLFFPL